jgi:uncharacterized protein HemY
MQQYRVNYPLLIGLIIGAFVCSGAIYGVHALQSSRQSSWLINEAERASAEKNFRDAIQYYEQYLTIQKKDFDTRIKYANAYLDLSEQDDVFPEELADLQTKLTTMLRNPDIAEAAGVNEVRRRFIKFYGRDDINKYSAGLDHINLLLDKDPTNVELQVLRATYLAKSLNVEDAVKYSNTLIGYDPKKGEFDVKKATSPHAVEVYSNLAGILHKDKPELAQKIANQMVEANRNSAAAYVNRGRLSYAWTDLNGARADSQQALQMKPDNADALVLAIDLAMQGKDFDKARAHQLVTTAKKLHPKDPRFYQRSADLEMRQNKPKDAVAELDAGAKAVGGGPSMGLLILKARLQIETGDVKGARQSIEDMQQKHRMNPDFIDYFDATILVAEGKWFEASEALSKLRPRMINASRDITSEIDVDLAMCHERLGQPEIAQQYYEQIVAQNPQNAFAVAGVMRTKSQRGLEPADRDRGVDPLQKLVIEELKKPKARQDWAHVNSMIDELAAKSKLDETAIRIFKFKIAMMHEDYDAAAKHLLEADKLTPQNLQFNRMKVQLARINPKIGPAKAMEFLENVVVKQFGDQPILRLEKAENLIALYKDKEDKQPLKQELAQLLSGIDGWTTQQKVDLWGGMARAYLSLNMIDEGRQYMNLAADNQPHELPLRLNLFTLALQTNDAEGMKAAEDKILQIVVDKNDSAWLYAEARRQLWLLRRGQIPPEKLGEIRLLVKRALDQRREWGELYALLAEIELMANNSTLALKHYDRAEELGRPDASAVAQHIKLLANNNRYIEAGKLLDRIPEAARQQLLGPYYAEVLFQTSQVDAALEQARAATLSDPTSAANHFWYGKLLQRSAQDPKLAEAKRNEIIGSAIQSMQKAVKLQPELPDAWFALISFQLMLNKETEAHKTMRDAQLVLSGENLSMFLARSYEALRRWFDAETMYREVYETNPNDLQRAKQLAEFYLGPGYPRNDKRLKATPLINQLLKAGAEGKVGADVKVAANDSNVLWARRIAAKLLAATRDYQNLGKAAKLLASNSQEGNLLVDDKLALAEILALRPEPELRKTALKLLEEVDKVQQLTEPFEVTRADLYFTTSAGKEWSKYQTEIEKALKRFPNSVGSLESYAEKLLARNDVPSIDRAVRLIQKLQEIVPNDPTAFQLTVRLADKIGKQKEVLAELHRRLPNVKEIKTLDDEKKRTLAMFAELLVELHDLDTAEQIYRDMAAKDPKMVFQLARFQGVHRAPEQCFATLKELYSVEKIPDILTVAMSVVRERRDKIGDKFDADIQGWIKAGLQENPDSINLQMVQADLFDVQKKFDESANVYRLLLDKKDLTGLNRAFVLNNLAFLIALAGPSAANNVDPMVLVHDAEDILGPNSDILDTRAVVHIARKEYKQAINDLVLSVTDKPTASKFFHKAVAHLGAGDTRGALEAWKNAEALTLNRDAINRMEFDLYEKTKAQIDKLRGPSVTKVEPRKAG